MTRTLSFFSATTLLAAAVNADVTLGSFESPVNLGGWTTTGTVAASLTPAPTEGLQCALLTSRSTAAAAVATFVGCPLASLQTATGSTRVLTNGAAMKRTFSANAGDTLQFDFRFNNAESTNDIAWPDSAIFILDDTPTLLATAGNLPHGWTPAFVTFSKTNLTAGDHTIAFAVFNLNDLAVDSQLAVDNVKIVTPPSPCGIADLGIQGGQPGRDSHLDNNDFVAFIDLFFVSDTRADLGIQGGTPGTDGQYDNNDFVAFITAFFDGQAACGG